MALNFKRIFEGLGIVPKTTSTVSQAGEMDFDTTNSRLNLHNGSSSSPVVTVSHAAQGSNRLQNKDLDDTTSAIVDSSDTTKKILFNAGGTTGTTSTITGAQTASRVLTLPDATTTLVGTDFAQTLTNKTIDADSNTITNIENADIKSGAAIAVNKLAALTANRAVATDSSGFLVASTLSDTDLAAALTATNTATVSNKSLEDSTTFIIDNSDNTKKAQFQVSGITTGTTRTFAFPDISDTLVTLTSADQGASRLKNKDLDTASVFFDDGSGLTGKVGFDVVSSSGTLTISSLISTSKTAFIPDHTGNYNIVGDAVTQQLTNKDIDGGTASNSRRITVPKDTKTNLDALTRKEGTIVYASDQDKLYVDDGSTLKPVGSGAGGGVNFLVLDSSFQPTQSDNSDFEASVGSWVTYADAAGVMPVDMTGGSPSITMSRTTTAGEVLDGAGSLKVVKGAANEQGEGISCVANVPLGYRGQIISIQFPFKVISGTVVDGDIRFYVYDITNSQIITPVNNYTTATGLMKMTFAMPSNTTQIRVGLHFATAVTTAVTYTIDDMSVGPQEVVFGPSMTDWLQDNSLLSFSSLGTTSNQQTRYRIIGDTLYVDASIQAGTVAASPVSIDLPTKFVIDSSKLASGNSQGVEVGKCFRHNGSSSIPSTAIGPFVVFYDEADETKLFIAGTTDGSGAFDKDDGSGLFGNSDYIEFNFEIPIVGLSTNVVQQNASTFRISNYLANGTRVTGSAPTELGQYRSYLRNASAQTYTETNGAPTTSPTAADGIVLYQGSNYSSANSNNSPTKYDIFVGKDKVVDFQFFSSSGRTGRINTDITVNGTTSCGINKSYDPSTGIATIVTYIDSFATTAGGSGYNENNVVITSDIYADILVSEKVIPVQLGGESEIWLQGDNGYGSASTSIVRWSTVQKNIGSSLTLSQSATLGDSITVNDDGNYSVSFSKDNNAGQVPFGVSKNTTQPTTGITAITASDIVTVTMSTGVNYIANCSDTLKLNRGDVLRAHADNTPGGVNAATSYFRVTKVR